MDEIKRDEFKKLLMHNGVNEPAILDKIFRDDKEAMKAQIIFLAGRMQGIKDFKEDA